MRKFVYRFTQKWWAANFGLNFDQRYYHDPLWRVACHVNMQRILQEALPEVPTRCSALYQGNVGLILDPVNIVMGICGAQIRYLENQDPWTVSPIFHSIDEIENFQLPDLGKSKFLAEQVAQFNALTNEYPLSEIEAFGTGTTATFNSSLVCGHKLAGEDLFVLMIQKPDLVHRFLCKVTELNILLIEFWSRLRNVEIKDLFIGDCSASLLSPRLYHEFSLPYNAQVVKRYHATYGVHSCGPSTHVVKDLVSIPGASWCEVGFYTASGHTNLAKARQILLEADCPEIRVLLNAGDVMQWNDQDIQQHIYEVIDATQPLQLVLRTILDEGVSIEKVKTLYQFVEGSLERSNS
jgi:hypothetical protein